MKGNLEEKRRILNSLALYVEPILKSRKLQNAGYRNLESDTGFLLNNFHVRHNNMEGKTAQDYILSIDSAQLEEWYDKIYNTLLSVIIISEQIDITDELGDLKKNFTWRT